MIAPTTVRHELWAYNQFKTTKGIIEGSHLVLSGGAHSATYLNADRIFPDSLRMMQFYRSWRHHFFDGLSDGWPQVIIAPATGGVYLVGGFSQHLASFNMVIGAVWTDKAGEHQVLERSRFACAVKNKRVLVLEDVITSAKSVKEVISVARNAGGNVIGVGCMASRNPLVTAEMLQVDEYKACWQADTPSFSEGDCPLCAQAQPIVTNIGHGSEFALKHPDYAGGYTELAFDE